MRLSRLPFLLALGLAVVASASGEDVVRTVRAELSGQDLSRFSVENLAGTMRISTGTGDSVTVVATVHAESEALADAVRIERVAGKGGAATLRVRYPYDRVPTFRYEEPGSNTDGFFLGFVSASSHDYDGHHVRVSPGHGKKLYADLEVRVPTGRLQAAFRQLVGLLDARGLNGELRFEVESADLRLSQLDGDITLEGSSGDTRARDIKGTWKSRFSSGDLALDGFAGDALSLTTTSGDFVVKHVQARRAQLQATSGDAHVVDADVEEFVAEATSGDVALESSGERLKDVQIRTSSGDVSLQLPAGAAFDLEANQSSGDMEVRFSDGSMVNHHGKAARYHRGSGGAHIRVRTSSGDLTVSPG
jgi:hypothetical protein